MKLFVWDYHGVMEKGNHQAFLEIGNAVLQESGYSQRFTLPIYNALKGQKLINYFSWILPQESEERHYQLWKSFLKKSRTNPEIILKNLEPNDYLFEVLQIIHTHHQQIVISNAQPESLTLFLKAIGIGSFFPKTRFFGADSIKNQTKTDILKNYLRHKQYEDIVIIGDAIQDMELKSVAGGITYLYKPVEIPVNREKVDYIIHDLRDILREVIY